MIFQISKFLETLTYWASYGLLTICQIWRESDEPTWCKGTLYFSKIPPQDIFLCFKLYLFFNTGKFLDSHTYWRSYSLLTICKSLKESNEPTWSKRPLYFSKIPPQDIFCVSSHISSSIYPNFLKLSHIGCFKVF